MVTEVVGNIIHCKNYKSRLTKENAQIDVRLTYKHGLDKHYGLLELGENMVCLRKYLQDMNYLMVQKYLVSLSIVISENILQRGSL